MSTVSDYFGCMVFDDRVMKANLSADVYASLRRTIDEGAKLDASVANAVAAAMKDWAVAHGATHYTHWFQPLTGITAENKKRRQGRDEHTLGDVLAFTVGILHHLSPFVNTLHKKSFLSLDRLTRPDKLNIIISEA